MGHTTVDLHTIGDYLFWANQHGLWQFFQAGILFVSFLIGMKLIYFPARRVRNLNFFAQIKRDDAQFPLRIQLEIRNFTGRTLVLSSPYFKYQRIRPDPRAHGDTPSGEFEVRFPDPSYQELREVEYMLRNKEMVSTVIPLDPLHADSEVEQAMSKRKIGVITCMCTWLDEKPRVHKLMRRI